MKNLSIAEKMNLPWVESPFFYDLLKKRSLSQENEALVTHYHEEGFIVLRNAVNHPLIDSVISDLQAEFPQNLGEQPARHQDIWKKYQSVKELASQPQIFDVLRLLYEREPIPFQTLNFKFGTQQRAHSDTIHFSCIPARYMCGVWVALEDTNANNGPLFYYPRSHRSKEFNYFDIGIEPEKDYAEYWKYEDFMEELMEAQGTPKVEIHMNKGDVLIWSSNLIHGGTPIRGGNVTRWSQVSHYYFEDCVYYSPRLSDMFANNLNLRHVINIATGEVVQHSENGKPIETINTGDFKYAISHNFSIPVLTKEIIKRIIGKKPF
jgi:ectoine hydroxylase-related dioxygenase (phytanoyl-CoA dioxygenase family)